MQPNPNRARWSYPFWAKSDGRVGDLRFSWLRLIATIGISAVVLACGLLALNREQERNAVSVSMIEKNNLLHDSTRFALLAQQSWANLMEVSNTLAGRAMRVHRDDSLSPPWSTDYSEVADMAAHFPAIVQVAAVDSKGIMLWSTLSGLPSERLDLSDREHIQAVLNGGKDFWIGRTVIGRLSGRETVQLTYRVADHKRQTLGAIVVSVDTRHLLRDTEVRETGSSGSNIVIELLRSDGVTLAVIGQGTWYPVAVRRSGDDEVFRSFDRGLARCPFQSSSQTGASPIFIPGSTGVAGYACNRVVGAGYQIAVIAQRSVAADLLEQVYGDTKLFVTVLSISLAAIVVLFITLRWAEYSRRAAWAKAALVQERQLHWERVEQYAVDLLVVMKLPNQVIFVGGRNAGNWNALHTLMPPRLLTDSDLGRFISQTVTEARSLGASTQSRSPRAVEISDQHKVWLDCYCTMPSQTSNVDDSYVYFFANDVSAQVDMIEQLSISRREIAAFVAIGPGRFYRISEDASGKRKIDTAADLAQNVHQFDMGSQLSFDKYDFSREAIKRDSRTIYDAVHLNDVQALKNQFQECIENGFSEIQYRLRTVDGSYGWVKDFKQLISKDPLVIVGCAFDIDDEHKRRVQQRQIERLTTLGEIATGISHELNQPLAAIAMTAENGLRSLRDHPNPEQLHKRFERIVAQIDRMKTIVARIRRFTRTKTDGAAAASVADAVVVARSLCDARLIAANVDVISEVVGTTPMVAINPVMLESAFVNLFVNSCDAYIANTEQEERRRTISVHAERKGENLEIRVSDTAGGIPEEILNDVFNPFFTTKPSGVGTGLGLSIVFADVSEAGGTISVSNANGGASFCIRLPIVVST